MLGPVEFAEVAGFNPESYAALDPRLRGKSRARPNKKGGKRRFSPMDRRGRRPY